MDIYKLVASKLGTHQIRNMPGFTLLEICMEVHWVVRLIHFPCRLALLIEFCFEVPKEEAAYILSASRNGFEPYVRIFCAAMFDKNSATQYAFKTKNVSVRCFCNGCFFSGMTLCCAVFLSPSIYQLSPVTPTRGPFVS